MELRSKLSMPRYSFNAYNKHRISTMWFYFNCFYNTMCHVINIHQYFSTANDFSIYRYNLLFLYTTNKCQETFNVINVIGVILNLIIDNPSIVLLSNILIVKGKSLK